MNTFRTALLLAMLTALFAAAGFVIGGTTGMGIAFLAALAMNAFSYWNSDKMVLRMQGASEVDAQSSPAYWQLVQQLAANAGLPMPRVYIMHSPQPNAFATGRNPRHAALCATTGLFELLSMEEVAGVLGHELAHVRNRDTLTMTMTATLAGAIGMLANYAQFGAIFGRGDNRRGNWLGILAVSLLAPPASCRWRSAARASTRRTGSAPRSAATRCGSPRRSPGSTSSPAGSPTKPRRPIRRWPTSTSSTR